LHSIPNIIQVIKPKTMIWAGQVALTGGKEIQTGFWWERMKGRYHLEDLAIDGRKVGLRHLKEIRFEGGDEIDLAQDMDKFCCEHRNERLVSTTCITSLNLMRNCWYLKDSASCSSLTCTNSNRSSLRRRKGNKNLHH
jgi:hypothetical protein